MDESTRRKRWHVAEWSLLAWLETTIKGFGLLIAIGALLFALTEGRSYAFPDGIRRAQWGILAFLSLGIFGAIFDRIIEREIVSMGFVIVNNLGHWGMVIAMLFTPYPDGELLAFAGLMFLGDLIKVWFLYLSGFTVRNTPRALMYGSTMVFVIGYLLIVVFGLAV
jgi:ABC-type Fe3+-siderophore transport system permease subunit